MECGIFDFLLEMFAFTLFETGSLHWFLFLPWSTHYRHCQTHKWALVMTSTWTLPPLINIFLSCHSTVRMSLTRVTALGKMILRLLTKMGGECYCSGLNGNPNNYVIHYSAERGCGILLASRELFSKLQTLLVDWCRLGTSVRTVWEEKPSVSCFWRPPCCQTVKKDLHSFHIFK